MPNIKSASEGCRKFLAARCRSPRWRFGLVYGANEELTRTNSEDVAEIDHLIRNLPKFSALGGYEGQNG
jgi:hypothetical protein